MRINPVLKNETKLAARSIKFTLVLFVYILLLSAGALFIFYQSIKESYFRGFDLQVIVELYVAISIAQAVLLMFIVPSLTATAISSEREKQTLDILLSSKMSTLSIVSGKLMASISRVILLIVCTMPIYSITLLIGGVNIQNILMLSLFFIITTIFVGSIGVCLSTFIKSSKVSTSVAYGVTLVLFIGIIVAAYIYIQIQLKPSININDLSIPWFTYLSPTIGFASLLLNQIGMSTVFNFADIAIIQGFRNAYIVSMIVQLVVSGLLVLLAANRLNPTRRKLLNIIRKFN